MRRALAAFLSLLVLLLPATAAAEEAKKLQVLTVMSNTAFQQAEALTVALKRAVSRADGWSLGKGDFSLEVMVAAFGCPEPPDATCLRKIEGKTQTKKFIWGTMEKAGDEVVVHLRLWDGSPKTETKLQYSSNLTDASDEALLKIAENAFGELVGLAPGKLVVLAKTPGMLSIDGKAPTPLEGNEMELSLPEGEHDVRLEAEGYEPLARTVKVTSGDTVEVEMNLVKKGTAAAGPKPPVEDEEPEEPTGSNRKLYGYIGLGAGAVFLGGGVFSALQVNSVNNDNGFDAYRSGLAPNQDVCDEADRGTVVSGAPSPNSIADKCSSASTFQTMQFVFFGLGAVATGAGLYFLLTGDDDPAQDSARSKTPRVRTAIGPQGGLIDVSMSF